VTVWTFRWISRWQLGESGNILVTVGRVSWTYRWQLGESGEHPRETIVRKVNIQATTVREGEFSNKTTVGEKDRLWYQDEVTIPFSSTKIPKVKTTTYTRVRWTVRSDYNEESELNCKVKLTPHYNLTWLFTSPVESEMNIKVRQ
jgi:hypothetical protein